MSRLVSEEFMTFLSGISSEITDVNQLFEVVCGRIGPVAEACGFGCLRAEICTDTEKHERVRMPEQIVIFESPEGWTEDVRELEYSMQERGCTLVYAAPRTGLVWTAEMTQNYQILSYILYLIVGRARMMDLVDSMIHTDDLTGLGNTAALFRFIDRLNEQDALTGMCFNAINIRHTREHNHLLGHAVGDRMLAAFAAQLGAVVGPEGFAGRLGGDSFVAVIPAAREDELLAMLQMVPVTVPDASGEPIPVHVYTRVGCYRPRKNGEVVEPLNNSSVALVEARRLGQPDVVWFTEEMRQSAGPQVDLLELAERAMDDNEFLIYYQPKVELHSRKLVGAEALARWKHGELLLTPSQFIPEMEKNGFVTRLDFFVFEQVCRTLRQWIAEGLQPVCVSSNFSRRHLADPDFADRIEAIVRRYGVDPALLEVEITESFAVDDMEQLACFRERMHQIGISVSIDDFGSGFSSLKLLKKVPADLVKIDKSIIDDIGLEYSADEIIAGHVIRMIRALNKKVVAEGVETEEQVTFLRISGCPVVQGYFFDKPLPEEKFCERLRNRQY